MKHQIRTGIECLLAPLRNQTDAFDIRLLKEQFQTSGLDYRFYRISPLPGLFCALVAYCFRWVPIWPLGLWLGTIFVTPFWLKYAFSRQAQMPIEPGRTRAAILVNLAKQLPVHLIWLAYLPLCWNDGNTGNNAFLMLFLLASVTTTLRVYGPCLHLILTLLVLYLPFCALYSLHTGTSMDIILPICQVLFTIFLGMLAVYHFRVFRQSVYRLFMIESLVDELALARDDADRANQAKSAFLASMSHELRTPLNAVIGFSDMMRSKIVGKISPPKYAEYVEDIFVSGQHLLDLINDVLDLSKIESGKRELQDDTIAIHHIVWDILPFVQPQANQDGIEIRIEVPKKLYLRADERAIRQILLNFLSNAVKFSPTGEDVVLFARLQADGGVDLGVSDHGIGMDKQGLKKALQPYGQVNLTTQRHSAGTGLGLPITKALVEAHDAEFHIESAVGVGTTVWGHFHAARVLPGKISAKAKV